MRPEQALWAKLRNNMKKSGWDATRHEDACTPGTPDVSWGARNVNGWLELKVIKNLTHKNDQVIPAKLRPKQRAFLLRRSRKGGHCAVLVWVSDALECFLFNHPDSFMGLGVTFTRQAFVDHCAIYTKGLPEPTRLLDVLTGQYKYGEL